MVSELPFYSDDPGSNPAEVYNFSVIWLFRRTKRNKKRPGWPFLKNNASITKQLVCLGQTA